MRNIILLLSIALLFLSCSKVSNVTGNSDASFSRGSSNSLKIISDKEVQAEVQGKVYDTKELKTGINVSYGTEIVLKAIDENEYEWIFNDWKAYGDVPYYDTSITFNITRNLVITVKE